MPPDQLDGSSATSGDWTAAEIRFSHPNVPSYLDAASRFAAAGQRRFLLRDGGDEQLRREVGDAFASTFGGDAIVSGAQGAVNVHFETIAEDCSSALMGYIDRPAAIIAPRTAHHATNRPIFLVAVPKSGFHLVSRVLSDMGIAHGGRFAGEPKLQSWHTLLFDHPHLPIHDFFAALSQLPNGGADSALFRNPIVFCYRHPCDIVVSETRYYADPAATALAYYYRTLPFDRRLRDLIAEDGMIGTLAERMDAYLHWIGLPNVLPIAFEEIVGAAGGGSDAVQLATLWAMQLKLHVGGRPGEYARHLFGERNKTFRRGQIGGFREVFKPEHYTALYGLENTEFVERLGYVFEPRDASEMLPKGSAELRRRPLRFAVPTDIAEEVDALGATIEDETLYRWYGYLVARVRGRYCAIEPGFPKFDPFRDETAARWHLGSSMTELGELIREDPLADEPEPAECPEPAFEDVFDTRLVAHLLDHDINRHTLVRIGRRYIGTPHASGEIDYSEVDPALVDGAIVGTDRDDVVARIMAVPRPPLLALTGYHGHNIVSYRGLYFGIPIALGAIDIQDETQLDHPAIARDEDFEALKARLVGLAAAEADDGLPRLAEADFHGFNIILLGGAYHAIPQVAGAVDLTVRRPESIPGSRTAPTLELLKQRLAADLIAPPVPRPAMPADPGVRELAATLNWAIDRIETQVNRITRNEIGGGALHQDVADLRSAIAELQAQLAALKAERPPPS